MVTVVMQNDNPIGVAEDPDAAERIMARIIVNYSALTWRGHPGRWTGEDSGYPTIYLWTREFQLEK